MTDAVTVRNSGKAEMAFVQGLKPWHGLGDSVAKGASIEEWQKAAGMDWSVKRSRVRFGEGANQQVWDDQHVLFRSDTKAPLGIVSDGYKVVQPKQVLEFFRDLTESNGFSIETAGTLFGGKRFWALAAIGEQAAIYSKQDVMKGYLLLATSADGTLATRAKETTVCVVCNNTLEMALREAGKQVTVNHRSTFDANAVKDRLNIARGNFGKFLADMQKLARVRMDNELAQRLNIRLLADAKKIEVEADGTMKADKKEFERVVESRPFIAIDQLFNGRGMGSTLAGRDGTAWGWLNAVTEYADHHARARSVDNRLNSAWFGEGEELKNRAAKLALELV